LRSFVVLCGPLRYLVIPYFMTITMSTIMSVVERGRISLDYKVTNNNCYKHISII